MQKTDLIPQLEYLKSEHIDDLMEAKRIDEINQIISEGVESGKLNFEETQNSLNPKKLKLRNISILNQYTYEIVLYFMQLNISDEDIFYDYEGFIEILKNKHKPVANNIAELMEYYNLASITLQQIYSLSSTPL